MTVIELKKKKTEIVNVIGKLDAWLANYVGKLKSTGSLKETEKVHSERAEKINKKTELTSQIRLLNVQIQEEVERENDEQELLKEKKMDGRLPDNEYLRLILEELRAIRDKLEGV